MKLAFDPQACEANGCCVRAAPEVFQLPEDDRLRVLVEEVPPELRAKVEKAVRDCPRRALSLVQR